MNFQQFLVFVGVVVVPLLLLLTIYYGYRPDYWAGERSSKCSWCADGTLELNQATLCKDCRKAHHKDLWLNGGAIRNYLRSNGHTVYEPPTRMAARRK